MAKATTLKTRMEKRSEFVKMTRNVPFHLDVIYLFYLSQCCPNSGSRNIFLSATIFNLVPEKTNISSVVPINHEKFLFMVCGGMFTGFVVRQFFSPGLKVSMLKR